MPDQQPTAAPTGTDAGVRAPHGALPEGGTVRPITRWGTPVMHRAQQPVTAYDDALATLAADMVATMYAADGVGLAACQVGEDVAMFVFDCPDDEGVRTVGVVCNPVLTLPEGKDRQLDSDDEGCLSYPGSFEPYARPDWARVDGFGIDGEPRRSGARVEWIVADRRVLDAEARKLLQGFVDTKTFRVLFDEDDYVVLRRAKS